MTSGWRSGWQRYTLSTLCSARPSEAKLPATAAGSAAPMSQEIPAFKSSILENEHGYATLKSSHVRVNGIWMQVVTSIIFNSCMRWVNLNRVASKTCERRMTRSAELSLFGEKVVDPRPTQYKPQDSSLSAKKNATLGSKTENKAKQSYRTFNLIQQSLLTFGGRGYDWTS